MQKFKTYFDQDADLEKLKSRTVAILGYGAQGRAHALNVRDSGCPLVIGQRPGGPNYELAIEDGFEPVSLVEATRAADIINVLL